MPRLPALLMIALLASSCGQEAKTIVRRSVPDVFFVARIDLDGSMQIDGPLFGFPFDANLDPEQELVLVAIDQDAVTGLHPRATTDLSALEAVAEDEPHACERRFGGTSQVDVPARNIASLERLVPDKGSFEPVDGNLARAMERVRIYVPLDVSACPRFAGQARKAIDATDLIDPDAPRESGTVPFGGAYFGSRQAILVSNRTLYVYDLDDSVAAPVQWHINDALPPSPTSGWDQQMTAAAVSPAAQSGVDRILLGAAGALQGEKEDPSLLEMRRAPDTLEIQTRVEIPVHVRALAIDETGAWAGGSRDGSVTSTAVDSGAELYVRDDRLESVTFVSDPLYDVALAGSDAIRLDRIEPSGNQSYTEFGELDNETGIVSTGSSRTGQGLFFASETALFRFVDGEWVPYSFISANIARCPALVVDECGRASPGVGFDAMTPVGDSAIGFMAADCSGVVVLDPELDCADVLTVPASRSVEAIDERDGRVLIVERGAVAFEAEIELGP